MRPSNEEIIRALRCISTATGNQPCNSCPYLATETVGGEEYVSCDVDQIGLDAADELELLTICKREDSEWPETRPLTEEQRRLVLTLAACNMRPTRAAKLLGKGATTVDCTIDRIHQATGLDPRNFFDLAQLVRIVKEAGDG